MRKGSVIVRCLLYTCYALVVASLYLYWSFPYDLLAQRLEERLAPHGVHMRIARLQPAIIPSLRAEGVAVQIDHFDRDRDILQVARLRVQPDWLALLSGKLQLLFQAWLYDGSVQGQALYTTADGVQGWALKLAFAGLDVAQHPLLQRSGQAFLHGEIGGDSTMTLGQNGLLRTGMWTLRGQDVVFAGQALQLPLQKEITCATIESDVTMDTRRAGKVEFSCQGDDLSIETTGTARWRHPLPTSYIDLRWQVSSAEAYKKELEMLGAFFRLRPRRDGAFSFRTYGPIQRPRVGA